MLVLPVAGHDILKKVMMDIQFNVGSCFYKKVEEKEETSNPEEECVKGAAL